MQVDNEAHVCYYTIALVSKIYQGRKLIKNSNYTQKIIAWKSTFKLIFNLQFILNVETVRVQYSQPLRLLFQTG